MSQENVALLKWLIDAFNRRDYAEVASKLHEDVEWVPAVHYAMSHADNEFRGVEGFWRWIAATDEAMSVFEIGAEAYRDLRDDRVLLLGVLTGRGRASGAEVRAELGQVFTFRDGQVVSYRGYLDRAEALEAVGLSE